MGNLHNLKNPSHGLHGYELISEVCSFEECYFNVSANNTHEERPSRLDGGLTFTHLLQVS